MPRATGCTADFSFDENQQNIMWVLPSGSEAAVAWKRFSVRKDSKLCFSKQSVMVFHQVQLNVTDKFVQLKWKSSTMGLAVCRMCNIFLLSRYLAFHTCLDTKTSHCKHQYWLHVWHTVWLCVFHSRDTWGAAFRTAAALRTSAQYKSQETWTSSPTSLPFPLCSLHPPQLGHRRYRMFHRHPPQLTTATEYLPQLFVQSGLFTDYTVPWEKGPSAQGLF